LSRETDSTSSGPQGRGGAAYPSGTPPYGPRPFPSLHPQDRPRPAAPEQQEPAESADTAEEPRTETTLTTRIRINIPGSRPIPPVVVRTPVEEGAAAPAPEPAAEEPAAEAAAEPEPEPEKTKETSDWFAPRKPVTPPQGTPVPQPGPAPAQPGPAAPGGPQGDGGFGGGPAAPFGGGPAAPGGPVPPPAAPAAEFFGGGPGPAGGPGGDDLFSGPFASPYAEPDTGSHPAPAPEGFPPPGGAPFDDGQNARGPHDTPSGGFASPYTGSDTGQNPVHRPAPASPFGPDDFPPGVPRPADRDAGAPAGPTDSTTGTMPIPTVPELSREPVRDDLFRPQGPRTPGPGGPPPGQRLSGDTLVGGIPAVPPGESRPRSGPARPGPVPPRVAEPAAQAAPSGPAAAKKAPAKKGRSKLVLLCAAVGGVAVVAYGAGLLMNHADVPKGTTVLGTDIGNMKQDAAVQALDKSLGDRATADLTVSVDGRKESLKPSVAGLSIDVDATVQKVAHPDYNPVAVFGTLLGHKHPADPVVIVDQDKLKAALKGIEGTSGTGSDGMVKFTGGKAVAVPGKPGKGMNIDAAAAKVAAAYRQRAQSDTNPVVALPVTTVPPKVTQAELDKAVNGFGKTAMMGPVYVGAGPGHDVEFNTTLPQFLTMQATPDGKLAPHIDLKVLQSLYGNAFQGVLLQRGDGSKTPVTPQDVATALIPALSSSNPADRSVQLPNIAQ
jgi:hypothetical protein